MFYASDLRRDLQTARRRPCSMTLDAVAILLWPLASEECSLALTDAVPAPGTLRCGIAFRSANRI